MSIEKEDVLMNVSAQDTFDPNDVWHDDLLQRKEVAKDYTRILKKINSPAVISINASYGRGKTFFLKRWLEELKQQNTIIYFNAWDNDFTPEPLVAFALEFNQSLKEMGLISDKTLKSLGKTVLNISSQLLLAAGKTATFGALDFEKLSKKEKEDFLESQSGYIAAAQVEAHLNLKKNVISFKSHLTSICKEIESSKKSKGLPIYIFIDELDRCRPTFSISFLERIKHYFNVPGLVFIIATDHEQLQHSIKSVYGHGFDGQGYLRRFIDLELSLPNVTPKKYISRLFSNSELDKKYPNSGSLYNCGSLYTEFYTKYAEFFDLSLRDIQRGMNTLNVALTLMSRNGEAFFPPILAFLVAARQRSIKFYEKIGREITRADIILSEAEKLMNKPNFFSTDDLYEGTLEHLLIATLFKSKEDLKEAAAPIIEQYDNITKDHNTESVIQLKRKKYHYERAIKLVEDINFRLGFYDGRPPIMWIKEKIDVGARY